MIELAQITQDRQKAPKKRTATVKFTPHAPEGNARPLTVQESRAALLAKFEEMRLDMTTYIRAMFSKNEGQDRDFKGIKREQEAFRTILASFGARLSNIEKVLKVATRSFTPSEMIEAGLVQPLKESKPSEFLTTWEKRIREEIERLKDLPETFTPNQLAAHFAVGYQTIQKFWNSGRLDVVRTDGRITITREAVAQFVSNYGTPRRRSGNLKGSRGRPKGSGSYARMRLQPEQQKA